MNDKPTGDKRKLDELEEKTVAEEESTPDNAVTAPKSKKKKKNKNKTSVNHQNGNDKNPDDDVNVKSNVKENEDESEKTKLDELEKSFAEEESTQGNSDSAPKSKKKNKKKKKNNTNVSNQEGIPENSGDGIQVQSDRNETEDKNGIADDSSQALDTQGDVAQKAKKKKNKKKKNTPAKVPVNTDLASAEPFSSLKDSISEETMKAINEMGFINMTPVQSKAIPPLLEGKDVRGTAKTGSGKTLAFIIPTVERLSRLDLKPSDGTGAIIISPTRELSIQTYNILKKVIKGHKLTSGIVIGGIKQDEEIALIKKGINVLVATPGRLLAHLKNTPELVIKNLACLIIDEADCILDIGFEEEMNSIIELLPKNKQTMFFSATRNKKVNLLARLSLNSEPLEVEISDPGKGHATVDGLEQAYVICPREKKFLLLHNFLVKNQKKKILVFFITCRAVQFYQNLLLNLGMKDVKQLHGKKPQEQRTNTFYEFCKAESGILLCTDVGARGWDVPSIDWIVQFDPPEDSVEYIHRVGRTARAGGQGKALMFLCKEEQIILEKLKNHNIPVTCENFTWDKTVDLQLRVEKTVKNNAILKTLGIKAFASIVLAYTNDHKKNWNMEGLDLKKIAKSFGFDTPPPLPTAIRSKLDEILPEKEPKERKKLSSKARRILKNRAFMAQNSRANFHGSKKGTKRQPFAARNSWGGNVSKGNKFRENKNFKEKHTFKANKVFKAKHRQ